MPKARKTACPTGQKGPLSKRDVPRLIGRHQKPAHHMFEPGLVKGDLQLVALDPFDPAITEFLVKHPRADGKCRHRLGIDPSPRAP